MTYTESQSEQVFISLLETEGYNYMPGKDVVRSSNQEVFLKETLGVDYEEKGFYGILEEFEIKLILAS